MFVSTREMLNQMGERAPHQAKVEKHYGITSDASVLLSHSTLGPILSTLGADAFSDEALRMLAVSLDKLQPKVSFDAEAVSSPS